LHSHSIILKVINRADMSISINSLTYIHPDQEVQFEGLDLSVAKGDKAALVGNNGAGKSTLLQILAFELPASSGEVVVTDKPWFVPQHLGQFDDLTIAAALGVDKKLTALKAIIAGNADTLLFEELDDDWEIEDKVHRALTHWDIAHLSAEQKMNELSGGEKTKVFLAGIDIWQPAIILLDEPTNHLDVDSRSRLYDFISTSRSTILIVSHDRILLNLISKMIEISRFGLEAYGGNYDFYVEQKGMKLNALQSNLEEQSKSLKQAQQKAREQAEQRQKKEVRGKAQGLTNSLPRIIAGGLKSKAEQSTAKVLEKHQEKTSGITENIQQLRSQIQQYQILRIDIGTSGLHQGKLLLDVQNINFSYGGKPLWDPLTFQVRSAERIRISGKNGTGKTTLLRMINAELESSQGFISRSDFNYLYLDQDYTLINRSLSVFEQISAFNSRHLEEHQLKSLLIYSQFSRESWDRKTADLSGGEKMKLSLCCLAVANNTPDMLILDEPTNNLDLQSLQILSASIKSYNGTIVVVSHDQQFINDIRIDKEICLKAMTL
jgi:ATPase subunit of ABC transporter with duplicated ATPase domains